jgi:hypothetical protein
MIETDKEKNKATCWIVSGLCSVLLIVFGIGVGRWLGRSNSSIEVLKADLVEYPRRPRSARLPPALALSDGALANEVVAAIEFRNVGPKPIREGRSWNASSG